MERECRRCRKALSLEEFHRYGDGYQSWCKACKREYAAEYWVRNRAVRAAYNKRQKQLATAWYIGLKRNRPCADCGRVFHPVAMQWDHRPGEEKIDCVAKLYNYSRATVLAEMEKCDLVCANCHAVRTHERRQSSSAPGRRDADAPILTSGPRSSAG